MRILDWNKLTDKRKKEIKECKNRVYIMGPVDMSKERVMQLAKLYKGNIIFGCLKDDEIPDLESSFQFMPLKLIKLIDILKNNKDISILKHFHKDTKYIIKELEPLRVVFINGSWAGLIHYNSFYWAAVDRNAKIELISPFVNEKEALGYQKGIYKSRISHNKLYVKNKKYKQEDLMKLTFKISKYSWDWVGQIGTILVKKGRILAATWNRVLPYEAYQMHFGSIREKKQIPSQEMIETHLTNHAECEILETARRERINIKGSSLFINIFPCPVCARVLSRTEIKEIVYTHDHNLSNDIGYKILEMSGKRIKRLVV